MFSIFSPVSCFLGFHDWEDWKYEADHSCRQIRICKRPKCRKQEEGKIKHILGQWHYKYDKYCQLIRTCERCNHTEEGEFKHIWGRWHYKYDKYCQLIRTCKRCNHTEEGKIQHEWLNWAYGNFDPWQEYLNRLFKLNQILIQYCSLHELNKLCLKGGIDADKLAGTEVPSKVKELVFYLHSNYRINDFLTIIKRNRPDIYCQCQKMGILEVIIDEEAITEKRQKVDIRQLSWQNNPNNPVQCCHQTRVCARCGDVENRTQHNWGEETYESQNSCRIVKYCHRCGKKSNVIGEDHKWGEWLESPVFCRLERHCPRCGEYQKGKDILHNWSAWDYESPISCRLVRRCQHCHEKEIFPEIKHDWSAWDYESPISCRLVRRCQRCDNQELGQEVHQWGDWNYESETSCRFVNRCPRCEHEELGQEVHQWSDLGKVGKICQRCRKLEFNISGVWIGNTIWSDGDKNAWELHLKQIDSTLSGTLIVSYLINNQVTAVKQMIAGKIEEQQISFHGISYSFINKGLASNYLLDNVVGKINGREDSIEGKVSDKRQSGNLMLQLKELAGDDSVNL